MLKSDRMMKWKTKSNDETTVKLIGDENCGWGRDKIGRQSTRECIVIFVKAAITWRNKTQEITLLTCELKM